MKTGFGLVLATSLAIATGACAGGGSTGGGAPAPTTPAPETDRERVDPGESPRNNEFTASAEEHLEQGMEAEEQGDEQAARTHYQQAADAARQAIEGDPRNPLPWLQSGIAHIALDDYQAADSMLARAEELRPLYEFDITPIREQAWIDRYEEAVPLVNSGDYAAAAEIFEDAHTIYQERPEVMLTLGQIWAQQGRYDEAVEILTLAREIIQNEEVRETLADSTILAGWDEQAEEVRPVIAQSLMNAGRLDEGAQALRELVDDHPENLDFRRNLANLYVQMEQPDSAAAIYEELIGTGRLGAAELYQIGIGFYQLENYDRAAEAFQQAVSQAPRDRDAAEMWARSLQIGHPGGEENDTTPESVLRQLREGAAKWVELDPYSQAAHVVLARTESRLGNQERAEEVVESISSLPLDVENLALRRMMGGGATVTGDIQNLTGEQGTSITIQVTFYGEENTPVGTGSVTVQLPAPDASQNFEVVLESDQRVMGYTYTLEGI